MEPQPKLRIYDLETTTVLFENVVTSNVNLGKLSLLAFINRTILHTKGTCM